MLSLPPQSIQPRNQAAWRNWLRRHHAQRSGVWVVTYKQSTGLSTFNQDRAREEALCYGWIDSLPRKLDTVRTMLYFAPRKPKSNWSAFNKRLVERLIAEHRMARPGLKKIMAAKRDGSWTALDSVSAFVIPADLRRALKARPKAQQYFTAFPPSTKKAILEWILNAKQPETRRKRIHETVRLAAKNIRANQWRQPSGRRR